MRNQREIRVVQCKRKTRCKVPIHCQTHGSHDQGYEGHPFLRHPCSAVPGVLACAVRHEKEIQFVNTGEEETKALLTPRDETWQRELQNYKQPCAVNSRAQEVVGQGIRAQRACVPVPQQLSEFQILQRGHTYNNACIGLGRNLVKLCTIFAQKKL